ncbi:MAG: hypothetical protein KJ060_15780 [Candidatus Hydrogenedentes bacterium]|nr:hypothetical protein [Candidatus Hydrogenedentota bacterium]
MCGRIAVQKSAFSNSCVYTTDHNFSAGLISRIFARMSANCSGPYSNRSIKPNRSSQYTPLMFVSRFASSATFAPSASTVSGSLVA